MSSFTHSPPEVVKRHPKISIRSEATFRSFLRRDVIPMYRISTPLSVPSSNTSGVVKQQHSERLNIMRCNAIICKHKPTNSKLFVQCLIQNWLACLALQVNSFTIANKQFLAQTKQIEVLSLNVGGYYQSTTLDTHAMPLIIRYSNIWYTWLVGSI